MAIRLPQLSSRPHNSSVKPLKQSKSGQGRSWRDPQGHPRVQNASGDKDEAEHKQNQKEDSPGSTAAPVRFLHIPAWILRRAVRSNVQSRSPSFFKRLRRLRTVPSAGMTMTVRCERHSPRRAPTAADPPPRTPGSATRVDLGLVEQPQNVLRDRRKYQPAIPTLAPNRLRPHQAPGPSIMV